eukprot:scaffold275386_cov14-Prasinocladus_malaysianus.AAC.1
MLQVRATDLCSTAKVIWQDIYARRKHLVFVLGGFVESSITYAKQHRYEMHLARKAINGFN